MAKQLNTMQVNLAFSADTSKVKTQLQDLQTRLSNLTAGKRIPGMELGITKDIQEGISAAAQLKVQLEQATNINTGKLDLTKFSQSLKDSNMSIDKYAISLKKLGPQGQEAFLQLTRSISNAEVPLLHVNERLNEMWTTLKNTARWQISSSVLHGFMGAIQSAYGYAQDLNESLNNIRIVSGQSTEQMARFADQANKAAKALSATTIDYTNAALIYYQQGLNEQEIEERTEVTLKMANVSRESAEVVSDQMTAVWNNFYDGGKSLEYYADVMTALGAETASSTAEISDGLEKFAAVAETVGLSYEYATASLATITATTRQSADVVGTALKTLFARIQGLSLGETLEDGVNLTKYSEALSKVGISIFEQNGELKAMDNILEEMGSKWETLNKSQQTALAQTVAGARQYTQLIALMDNWDFMQENLETAKNSEGALQEQANIYAESWEAASDRVQAAMEALYQDILDDDFFIDILNGVEKVLTGVDDLIDGLGGIKPILTIVSALFLKTFSGKIASGIKNVKDGIVSIANPEKAKQKAIATRQKSIDAGTKLINDISPDSKWGEVKRQSLTQEYAIQQSLLDNAGKITLEKQKEYQIRLDSLNLMQSELEVSAKKLDKDKASYEEQKKRQLLMSRPGNSNEYSQKATQAYLLKNEQMGQIVAFGNQIKAGRNIKDAEDQAKAFEKVKTRIQNAKTVDGDALNLGIDFNQIKNFDQLEEKLEAVYDKLFIDVSKIENIPSSIESVGKAAHDTAKEMVELNVQGENIGSVAEELQNDIDGSAEALTDWRTGLVDIAGNVAMLVGSLTALGSAWSELETSIQEGDISGAIGSLVAMASVLPMVSGGISTLLGTLKTVAPTMVTTNAATGALSLSLKGLSLSVPWLTVIATALTVLLPKILELIPTAKKARESIQEATQAYEEQKQVLDDLNNSLQTTKDRIEELNNQDTLTIIEQEELNKLKQELAYLERQKVIEEELAKAKQKEQASSIKKNFSTAYSGLIGSAPIKTRSSFGAGEETPDEYYERMLGIYNSGPEIDAESYASLKKEVDEWKAENEQNRIQWLNENNELIKQAEQDYYDYIGAITSGAIERDEKALRSQQKIISSIRKNIYSSESEYQQKHLNPILNTTAMTQNEDRIYSQINSGLDINDISISSRLQEELDLAGVATEEFLTYIADNIDETKNKIGSLTGGKTPETIEKINELTADDWQILAELNFENIETADELWEALDEYKNSKINIAVEGLEGVQEFLDSINAKEKPFEEMLSTYKDKGYFTMDEVDEILTANPEYVNYLQETEKGWVLTGQALKDYLQLEGQESIAIKEKIALLKEQNGVSKDYVQNYTSTWEELSNRAVDYQESMFGGSEDQVDLFTTRTEDLKAASEAYQAGTMTAEEYFSKIDTRLKGIGSGFHDLSDEIDDNVEKTDLYEATLTAATGTIADGLIDLNKQFKSGSINMDEYYEGTIAGTKALMTAQAKTNKYVEKAADGTYKLVDNVDDATKSMNEYKEAAQLVEDLNNWGEQVKDAEAMTGVVDTLTGNYDYLINYANEFGAIDFTIDNNFDTTSQQFQDMCTKMGESLTTVEDENNEAYKRILAGVEAQGFELANGLNTTAEQLQTAMSQDAALASAVINASMNESGNTITSVSQAAGKVLSALGELISNFEYTLEFDPYIKSGKFNLYEWVTSKGKSGIELPNIGFNITGSGGKSVNNFVNALNEAGNFLSSQGDGFGQGGIFDYGQEPLDFSPLDPNEIETDNIRKDGKGGKGGKDKYTPEIERYHEITRAIENQERALDDLSSAKDEAFGANKISLMEQELVQMETLKAKQQQLLAEAEKYLALDKAALMSAYPGAKIDANTGEILNFEELQRNTTSEEQNKILEQYESTIDKINEAKDALEDYERQIKSLEYEKLSYKLELKLEINDTELKKLEYLLDTYSDNFYKMAESAALMNDKLDPTIQKLEDYKSHKTSLDESYAKGKISQEAYIEGLKEIRDGYYENLEVLIELDKQMMHYREDTLSAAAEEVAEFTDHMEHLTEVFDHYLSLMDILGKTKDYEAMGNFLGGKADTIRDRLDVAKEYYEMLKENNNIDKYWANYQDALAKGDVDNAKWWKEQWDAEVDALDEAQEKMLGLTEEWAEAMKAVVENNMAEITDTLEKALTNGLGFDKLMDDFDKLNTRQEEYLTKTNQIYETNKLMRTANKALDETDNKVTKQKLKNFIDETKSLQENTQLSKYELEIQQAKYDLLLAEIALEEAQNAKSVVRLSRDSEGNFGYVYTADEDKVSDAQQKKEDAENRLYNISLDGQQEYTEKYLQAQQEFMDDLAELWDLYYNKKEISEVEFKKRAAQLEEDYYGPNGILTTYSKLYNVAVQTDANATADNWQTAYGEMTQNSEKWKSAISDYYDQVNDQITTWEEISTQANEDVSDALSNSEEATKKLTDESAILAETIETEVLDAIEKEIDAVNIQTEAYENQRQTLLELIDTYEDYINQINKDIKEQSTGYDKDTDYLAVMQGYLAAGGVRGSDTWNELERQRKAKIKGEGMGKDEYLYDTGDIEYDYLTGSTKDYKDKESVMKILRRLGISGFSSGGYTGEWGPSGKLAVLHEKEIVLNQDDTNNLLETVSLVRDLVSMIDAQAAIASLFNMPNMNHVNSNNHQTLEQTVTIHAEFPNATQHSEIEEAFSNLVNIASQYANRKI